MAIEQRRSGQISHRQVAARCATRLNTQHEQKLHEKTRSNPGVNSRYVVSRRSSLDQLFRPISSIFLCPTKQPSLPTRLRRANKSKPKEPNGDRRSHSERILGRIRDEAQGGSFTVAQLECWFFSKVSPFPTTQNWEVIDLKKITAVSGAKRICKLIWSRHHCLKRISPNTSIKRHQLNYLRLTDTINQTIFLDVGC